MKAVTCFILIFVFHTVISHQKSSVAYYALNSILNNFFAKFSPKIDVYKFELSDYIVVEKFLRIKNESISIQTFDIEPSSKGIVLNGSSILFFNSKYEFKEKFANITWQSNKSMRNKHIVYFPNATESDLIDIIKDGFVVDSVSFLVNENENSIDLVTSFMFTAEKCRYNQYKVINKFKKSNMRWTGSDFFPNKYTNLQGCTLNIAIYDRNQKGMRYIPVTYGEIVRALAQLTNFKIETQLFDSRNDIVDRSTSDIFEFNQRIDIDTEDSIIVSIPYLFGDLVLLIPPGELYSPLEKMFLIFDNEVWIWIAVLLLIAIAVIQIINFASIGTQNFVYGRNVKTPTLNIFSTFLIGNQTVLPGRNFARYLLMMFIIWSLIIRTCYQSEVFKYLQRDMRKPVAKTIQELFESGFTLYGTPEQSGVIMSFMDKEFQNTRTITTIYSGEYQHFQDLEIIADTEMKSTTMSMDAVLLLVNNQFRSGFSSLLPLKERIISTCYGLPFSSFSPFYETFNEKIHQLVDVGLTKQWLEVDINPRGFLKKLEEIGAEVLTMEHLDIAFKIILISIAISVLSFCAEVVWFKFRKILHTFKI